jgi:hypothetical protein
VSETGARRLVRVAGSAVLVLFVAFQVIGPHRPAERNPPGFSDPIMAFELAATPDDVLGILGRPGTPARAEVVPLVLRATAADFAFLLAYPALCVGIAALLVARGRAPRALLPALIALALVMAAADALEDRQLLVLAAAGDPGTMSIPLAWLRLFTLIKWYAIFLASALLAVFVWREPGWWRWSAPLFGATALVGAATALWPPAVEWTIPPLGAAWGMSYVAAFVLPRTSA